MKLKCFLSLMLTLILLLSVFPITAFAESNLGRYLSNPVPVEYETAYSHDWEVTDSYDSCEYFVQFEVSDYGIVAFAFDVPKGPGGKPLFMQIEIYRKGDSGSIFGASTSNAQKVENMPVLYFPLAPGTYVANFGPDHNLYTSGTYHIEFALAFEAIAGFEAEPNGPENAEYLHPGITRFGFTCDGNEDFWAYYAPTTIKGRLYVTPVDVVCKESYGLSHDNSYNECSDFFLEDVKKDENGDTYFDVTLTPGENYFRVHPTNGPQTTYSLCLIPLTITKQPNSVKVNKGSTAKISVQVSGASLSYQWYYKDKGASSFKKAPNTTATYTATMSNSTDGRQVYCVITDKYGNSVKTKTVTLSLKFGITKQPVNTTVPKNKTAKVSVSAVGEGLKYQWYYKDRTSKKFKASSTKTNTYSVKMTSSKNGRQVYCVIKDKHGNTFKTSTVTLKIASKIKITKQPSSSVKVNAGKKASVTVKASGDGLTYQWYYKNKGSSSYKKISGATAATYSVTMSASVSGRKVYCVVKDKYGQSVKSKISTLYAKTTIVEHPSFTTSKDGKKVTVSISAAGEKLTYKWYYKNPGAKKFTRAKSAKGSTYSFTNNSSAKGRQVYCVITSKYGGSVKTGTITISSASKCGKSLYWSWNTNGTLAITGSGPMYDYEEGKAPWNSIKSRIKTVIIDSGVTTIGARTFKSCSNLTSVSLPSTLTDIREWSFTGCKKLTTISIPNGVKTIGAYAFSACVKLKYIVLSDALQRIDEWAFNSCHSMKYVYLGRKLTRIHNGAFSQCDALTKLFYGGTEDTWLNLRIDANNLELTQASRKYVTSRNKLPV